MRISDWSSDVCSSDLTSQPDHLDRRTLQLCPSPGECEGPHSLISSLLVSILMAGSTPAIVPSASSTDEATTLEIKNTCLEAVNGDEAAEISCIKTILEHAEPMRDDELVADFKTNCLVIPTLSYGDLIWAYLGWLEEHPETDEKAAAMTINAALLEKIPCGWQKG